MTVAELIARLQDLPADLTVLSADYESGRREITSAAVDTYYGSLPRHVVIQ